jgi:hypothetical protein
MDQKIQSRRQLCHVTVLQDYPILLPALLISPFLGDEAADVVWRIALILCGLLTLAIAYQLGSVYG